MLASVKPPREEDSASYAQATYCPRSYEYNMHGLLPLSVYSRYLENTRVKFITNNVALLELLAGHPERIFAVRLQRWEVIGLPVGWLGISELICEASIGVVTPRSIVLRTSIKLGDSIIVQGQAVLVVIDSTLKKAITIPEVDRTRLNATASSSAAPLPPAISFPSVLLDDPATISTFFDARYSDMDSNRHLNQAKYIEYIENLIADCIHGIIRVSDEQRNLLKMSYASLIIEYQAEVKYPAKIFTAMKVDVNAKTAYFSIYKAATNQARSYEAIRARLSFNDNTAHAHL